MHLQEQFREINVSEPSWKREIKMIDKKRSGKVSRLNDPSCRRRKMGWMEKPLSCFIFPLFSLFPPLPFTWWRWLVFDVGSAYKHSSQAISALLFCFYVATAKTLKCLWFWHKKFLKRFLEKKIPSICWWSW